MLYKQHESHPFLELPSFNQAVDEFFSKMESQKLDLKAVQQVNLNFVLYLFIYFILENTNTRFWHVCTFSKNNCRNAKL